MNASGLAVAVGRSSSIPSMAITLGEPSLAAIPETSSQKLLDVSLELNAFGSIQGVQMLMDSSKCGDAVGRYLQLRGGLPHFRSLGFVS